MAVLRSVSFHVKVQVYECVEPLQPKSLDLVFVATMAASRSTGDMVVVLADMVRFTILGLYCFFDYHISKSFSIPVTWPLPFSCIVFFTTRLSTSNSTPLPWPFPPLALMFIVNVLKGDPLLPDASSSLTCCPPPPCSSFYLDDQLYGLLKVSCQSHN